MNLLTLPPELRLQIYQQVLVQRHPICINKGWHEAPLLPATEESNDSLEVGKMYYGENVFVYYFTTYHFSGPKFDAPVLEESADRIESLSKEKRAALRRMEIVCFWGQAGGPVGEARVSLIPRALALVINFGKHFANYYICTDLGSNSRASCAERCSVR